MKKLELAGIALFCVVSFGFAAEPLSDMAAGFREPGIAARPRAYWNWLNGDVALPDLTRDLEEAKAKGMGGLEMWDTEAMRNPGGFVPAGPPFMGPESVAASSRIFLDLGDVRELAELFVNGQSAGVLWKPPFRSGVTTLVRTGVNEFTVEVMNLLINCLLGDDSLPPERGFTHTNIRRGQNWRIQPAGLLGPVRLLVAEEVKIVID